MILPSQKSVCPVPFAREVLQRLPLAEAFYTLWAYLAPDAVLDDLFGQHRGRCYQDQLAFAELVRVLTDAVTRYHGSGLPAIDQALADQRLSTHARAVYGKLARLPLPLAEAFLAALTARLRPLFADGLYRSELPACLADLTVVVLDGKKIKNAAKRLLAVRGRPGKVFGGKLLVAYLPADGLAVALAADPTARLTTFAWSPACCRWHGRLWPGHACGSRIVRSATLTNPAASPTTATIF